MAASQALGAGRGVARSRNGVARRTHATLEREAIWREIWVVRLAEGKIVESWRLPDVDAYLRQLGCLAVPVS